MILGGILAATMWLALNAAAGADELADFHAAVERAAAHNRVALGYLRNANVDLAALELERMRDAWGALASQFGGARHPALRDNDRFVAMMVDVPTRVVAALLMLDMGRSDAAAASLEAIRQSLSAMRRAGKIEVLADCVLDANAAMRPLLAFDESPPDWNAAQARGDIADKTAAYMSILRRCERVAPAAISGAGEFRRLFDGALASAGLIGKAAADADNQLLHRILIELRSFDRLMTFRFG
ncbi:MAG: hypothetical protein HY056_11030 [Proteobacteria bacterium]|nr:hypothetical protein [Pseudomonadota bacterium]